MDHQDDEGTTDLHRKPGRCPNPRVRYLPSHPKYVSVHRVLRTNGHNALPNFIGRYFPRRDDPELYAFYYACMLVLLKPWRSISTDLKRPDESWESAFEKFVSGAPTKVKNILSGIQYFHECSNAAKRAREEGDSVLEDQHRQQHEGQRQFEELDDHDLGEDISADSAIEYTEEGLARLIDSQKPWREEFHGLHAVEQARHAKIFKTNDSAWNIAEQTIPLVSAATGDDLTQLLTWKEHMDADVNAQNRGVDIPSAEGGLEGGNPRVEQLNVPVDSNDTSPDVILGSAETVCEEALPGVDPSQLKPDQLRAYNIITWHLDRTLAGDRPPPLRMVIHGEGGMGKSRVIQTVTEYFAQRGAKHMLIKAAYTGVAASLIDGKTTHVIGMISRNSKNGLSDDSKGKLQAFWKWYTYLVLDEVSMISKPFLSLLSRNIGVGKQTPGVPNSDFSFGGVNVILCGDFLQFQPVAVAPTDALYHPNNMTSSATEAPIGRAIYEEFRTVVLLREQVRCTDPRWHQFLQNLRFGRVQREDLMMLRSLIINNPQCEPTDFGTAPWNEAFLVTPRHAVRRLWNAAANRKHCAEAGNQLFICSAEDTIRKRPLTLRERFSVAARHISSDGLRKRPKDGLPDSVELAIGMKVMVTSNLATDLDITNGARGAIHKIILHPDEPSLPDSPLVKLTYLPSYILVKLNRTRATQLSGL